MRSLSNNPALQPHQALMRLGVFFTVLLLLCMAVLVFFTSSHSASSPRPSLGGDIPLPLAEVLFNDYNIFLQQPNLKERENRPDAASLQPTMSKLRERHNPLIAYASQLSSPPIEDAFCFISHGCWGGEPPQVEAQQNVARVIKKVIARGFNISASVGDNVTSQGHASRVTSPRSVLPIRFVLAAGDNMYMDGVQNVWDTRFFTTFEDFYGGDLESDKDQTDLVPWLVALGNHDYRGNHTAQVEYTFRGPKERKAYQTHWESVLGKLSDTNSLFARRGKREMLERLRRRAVSGRWYLPHLYYAIQVSKDMVVVALDTVGLHRCAVARGDVDEDRIDKHMKKVSDADCTTADEQKRQVEKWLLEEYADVPFKIVVGHYPVMANGPHPNYKWLAEWLVPLLEKSGAAMYVNADNHYLQVSQQRGVFYVNSGGGGGYFGRIHRFGKRLKNEHPNSVFHTGELGVCVHCRVKDTSNAYAKIADSLKHHAPQAETNADSVLLHYVLSSDLQVRQVFTSDLSSMLERRQILLEEVERAGKTRDAVHPGYGVVSMADVRHDKHRGKYRFLLIVFLIVAGCSALFFSLSRRKGKKGISVLRVWKEVARDL